MTDAITLTNTERMELNQRANSRSGRAEDVRRARVFCYWLKGRTVKWKYADSSSHIRTESVLTGH
jgi:hypothetical protein